MRKRALEVDAAFPRPYLGGTMLRQLLTLLALITGLAATSAPAEARVHAADGARIEVAQRQAVAAAADFAAHLTRRSVIGFAAPLMGQPPLPRVDWRAPTVHFGPDRARE